MGNPRVLIVGIGSIGRRHARVVLHGGKPWLGICDPDAGQRQQARRLFPGVPLYSSLEEALKASWDLAIVCAPAHLHVPLARKLVQRGIHTLIEKPLAVGRTGIRPLITSADRCGVTAAVAYVYRCHPGLQKMRDLVGSGRFGPVVEVVAVSGQHFPHYRPDYARIYYARHQTGGGAIQDALPHVLDAVQWMAGPATHVAADAAHLVLPAVEVEDTVHVLARHGSVLAAYCLNQHQAPNQWSLTVHCRNGTIAFHYHENRLMWMDRPDGRWHVRHFDVQRDDLFARQWRAFQQAVHGKEPPVCSLAEGWQTLETTLAIQKSLQARRWVAVRQVMATPARPVDSARARNR